MLLSLIGQTVDQRRPPAWQHNSANRSKNPKNLMELLVMLCGVH